MLTTKEAAEMLQVSPRRVVALIEAGALKAQRLGRSWAVDEDSVRDRASSERLKGRPSLTHKYADSNARYTLMNHDHEVLSFTYNFQKDEVLSLEPLADIAWKPLGVGRLEKAPNRYDMGEWLRSRTIPTSRIHLASTLRDLEVSTPVALMFQSWGLSLTDPYWFKPEGIEASWSEINYFDNGYDEEIGEIILADESLPSNPNHKRKSKQRSGNRYDIIRTPDSTTDGMLGKRWIRKNGIDYLIKAGSGNENREPFNEKLATRLLKRILNPGEFVEYEVIEEHGRAYSSCKNMVEPNTELITAKDVLTAFAVSEGHNLFNGYLDALSKLKVTHVRQLIDKMLVVDHLMANFDRHMRNFGIIRNVESLDDYRIAPLFDHGCGFYCRATTAELESRPYVWESHPFKEYPSQQLALVEDLSWYDPDALEGFLDEIVEVFSANPEISERFIAAVQRQTARQIATVNDLAAERRVIVSGW